MPTVVSPVRTGLDIPVQLRKYAGEYMIFFYRGCWAALRSDGATTAPLLAGTPGGLAGAITADRRSRPRIPHQRAS